MMGKLVEENEHEIGDHQEETLLRKHDEQLALKGMWVEPLEGCPHRHGVADSVDVCDVDEMRHCIYELADNGSCELFQEIIHEWREKLQEDKVCQLSGVQ